MSDMPPSRARSRRTGSAGLESGVLGRGPQAQSAGGPDPFESLAVEHAALLAEIERTTAIHGRHRPIRRGTIRRLAQVAARHMRREERALYPVCERLFGPTGAVSVMRGEHASIARAFAALAAAPDKSLGQELAALAGLLEVHFTREERVLFPIVGALLTGTRADRLARDLQMRSDR